MPIAVVTGSSGGIGHACCKLLLETGWTVIGVDRCPASHSDCAFTLTCDVRDLFIDDDAEESGDDGDGGAAAAQQPLRRAKRPTTAALRLKQLLAQLSSSSSSPTTPHAGFGGAAGAGEASAGHQPNLPPPPPPAASPPPGSSSPLLPIPVNVAPTLDSPPQARAAPPPPLRVAVGSPLPPAPPQVHLLVHNAAEQVVAPLAAISKAAWDSVLSANLSAPFHITRLLLPELLAARGGASVVCVASIHASLTKPGFSAYAASKGGLVALAKAMAVELAPMGVRVNAVLPGAVDTPMLRSGFAGDAPALERLASVHPVRRVGEPSEVARLVAFLGDGASSGYINGAALAIDGGVGACLHDPAGM